MRASNSPTKGDAKEDRLQRPYMDNLISFTSEQNHSCRSGDKTHQERYLAPAN